MNGYLLPEVPLRVTVNRSDPRFYLLLGAGAEKNNYVFDITNINLRVPVVSLNESLRPMMPELISKNPARYFFNGKYATMV